MNDEFWNKVESDWPDIIGIMRPIVNFNFDSTSVTSVENDDEEYLYSEEFSFHPVSINPDKLTDESIEEYDIKSGDLFYCCNGNTKSLNPSIITNVQYNDLRSRTSNISKLKNMFSQEINNNKDMFILCLNKRVPI